MAKLMFGDFNVLQFRALKYKWACQALALDVDVKAPLRVTE